MLQAPEDTVPNRIQVLVRIRPPFAVPDAEQGEDGEEKHIAPGDGNGRCVYAQDAKTVQLLRAPTCRCEACLKKNLAALERKVRASTKTDNKLFTTDRVFDVESLQEEIYAELVGPIQSTVDGYNATVMCYGTTGSGKSYTMTGNMDSPGIIPRAIDELFATVDVVKEAEPSALFHIELSYVELYNNYFRNLIRDVVMEQAAQHLYDDNASDDMSVGQDDNRSDCGSVVSRSVAGGGEDAGLIPLPVFVHQGDRIDIHESDRTGVFLSGHYLRVKISSPEEAMRFILRGNQYKTVGATYQNPLSSRSHSILTFYVQSRRNGSDEDKMELRIGKLHLVDLAGSETLLGRNEDRLSVAETKMINTSLYALGDVLTALATNARNAKKAERLNRQNDGCETPRSTTSSVATVAGKVHVPYLNSKLTHALKDSLGGNSKTVIIANLCPDINHYHPTLYTLNFSDKARKVVNKAHINRFEVGDSELLDIQDEKHLMNHLKGRLFDKHLESLVQTKKSKDGKVPHVAPRSGGPLRKNTGPVVKGSLLSVRSRHSYKYLTLVLDSVQANDLEFVSFPMVPFVRFSLEEERIQRDTGRQLYFRNKAMYNNTFQIKLTDIDYLEDLELTAEVFNGESAEASKSKTRHVGKGKILLSDVIPMLDQEETFTIPLIHEPKVGAAYEKGSVEVRGMVRFFIPGTPSMGGKSYASPTRSTKGSTKSSTTPRSAGGGDDTMTTPSKGSSRPPGGSPFATPSPMREPRPYASDFSPMSARKTPRASPRRDSVSEPPAVAVPRNLSFSINSIAAYNMSKLNLIGKQARYSPMKEAGVSLTHIKQSEQIGKQDPYAVAEFGSFWQVETPTLRSKETTCKWPKLDMKCFVAGEDINKNLLSVNIFDNNFNWESSLVGNANMSLQAAAAKLGVPTEISSNLVDLKGRVAGKIKVICTVEKDNSRWFAATVKQVVSDKVVEVKPDMYVRGGHKYIVEFDDGTEEPDVNECNIRPTKMKFVQNYRANQPVEVSRGADSSDWVPGTVTRYRPREGTYDIMCDDGVSEIRVPNSKLRPPTKQRKKFRKGDRVQGNLRCLGIYYPAEIAKVTIENATVHYDVHYDKGDYEEDVDETRVKPVDAAVKFSVQSDRKPVPPVLRRASVMAPAQGFDWYPAEVREPHTDGSYSIELPNGMVETVEGANVRAASGGGSGSAASPLRPESSSAPSTESPSFKGQSTPDGSSGRRKSMLTPQSSSSRRFSFAPMTFSTGDNVEVLMPTSKMAAEPMAEKSPMRSLPSRSMSVSYDANEALPVDPAVSEEEEEAKRNAAAHNSAKFYNGQRVEANYRGLGRYFAAKIKHRHDDVEIYDVAYEDGRRETKISGSRIRSITADKSLTNVSNSHPHFYIGQKVLSNYRGSSQWYPGVIAYAHASGSYDIDFSEQVVGKESKELHVHTNHIRKMDEETELNLRGYLKPHFSSGEKVYVRSIRKEKNEKFGAVCAQYKPLLDEEAAGLARAQEKVSKANRDLEAARALADRANSKLSCNRNVTEKLLAAQALAKEVQLEQAKLAAAKKHLAATVAELAEAKARAQHENTQLVAETSKVERSKSLLKHEIDRVTKLKDGLDTNESAEFRKQVRIADALTDAQNAKEIIGKHDEAVSASRTRGEEAQQSTQKRMEAIPSISEATKLSCAKVQENAKELRKARKSAVAATTRVSAAAAAGEHDKSDDVSNWNDAAKAWEDVSAKAEKSLAQLKEAVANTEKESEELTNVSRDVNQQASELLRARQITGEQIVAYDEAKKELKESLKEDKEVTKKPELKTSMSFYNGYDYLYGSAAGSANSNSKSKPKAPPKSSSSGAGKKSGAVVTVDLNDTGNWDFPAITEEDNSGSDKSDSDDDKADKKVAALSRNNSNASTKKKQGGANSRQSAAVLRRGPQTAMGKALWEVFNDGDPVKNTATKTNVKTALGGGSDSPPTVPAPPKTPNTNSDVSKVASEDSVEKDDFGFPVLEPAKDAFGFDVVDHNPDLDLDLDATSPPVQDRVGQKEEEEEEKKKSAGPVIPIILPKPRRALQRNPSVQNIGGENPFAKKAIVSPDSPDTKQEKDAFDSNPVIPIIVPKVRRQLQRNPSVQNIGGENPFAKKSPIPAAAAAALPPPPPAEQTSPRLEPVSTQRTAGDGKSSANNSRPSSRSTSPSGTKVRYDRAASPSVDNPLAAVKRTSSGNNSPAMVGAGSDGQPADGNTPGSAAARREPLAHGIADSNANPLARRRLNAAAPTPGSNPLRNSRQLPTAADAPPLPKAATPTAPADTANDYTSSPGKSTLLKHHSSRRNSLRANLSGKEQPSPLDIKSVEGSGPDNNQSSSSSDAPKSIGAELDEIDLSEPPGRFSLLSAELSNPSGGTGGGRHSRNNSFGANMNPLQVTLKTTRSAASVASASDSDNGRPPNAKPLKLVALETGRGKEGGASCDSASMSQYKNSDLALKGKKKKKLDFPGRGKKAAEATLAVSVGGEEETKQAEKPLLSKAANINEQIAIKQAAERVEHQNAAEKAGAQRKQLESAAAASKKATDDIFGSNSSISGAEAETKALEAITQSSEAELHAIGEASTLARIEAQALAAAAEKSEEEGRQLSAAFKRERLAVERLVNRAALEAAKSDAAADGWVLEDTVQQIERLSEELARHAKTVEGSRRAVSYLATVYQAKAEEANKCEAANTTNNGEADHGRDSKHHSATTGGGLVKKGSFKLTKKDSFRDKPETKTAPRHGSKAAASPRAASSTHHKHAFAPTLEEADDAEKSCQHHQANAQKEAEKRHKQTLQALERANDGKAREKLADSALAKSKALEFAALKEVRSSSALSPRATSRLRKPLSVSTDENDAAIEEKTSEASSVSPAYTSKAEAALIEIQQLNAEEVQAVNDAIKFTEEESQALVSANDHGEKELEELRKALAAAKLAEKALIEAKNNYTDEIFKLSSKTLSESTEKVLKDLNDEIKAEQKALVAAKKAAEEASKALAVAEEKTDKLAKEYDVVREKAFEDGFDEFYNDRASAAAAKREEAEEAAGAANESREEAEARAGAAAESLEVCEKDAADAAESKADCQRTAAEVLATQQVAGDGDEAELDAAFEGVRSAAVKQAEAVRNARQKAEQRTEELVAARRFAEEAARNYKVAIGQADEEAGALAHAAAQARSHEVEDEIAAVEKTAEDTRAELAAFHETYGAVDESKLTTERGRDTVKAKANEERAASLAAKQKAEKLKEARAVAKEREAEDAKQLKAEQKKAAADARAAECKAAGDTEGAKKALAEAAKYGKAAESAKQAARDLSTKENDLFEQTKELAQKEADALAATHEVAKLLTKHVELAEAVQRSSDASKELEKAKQRNEETRKRLEGLKERNKEEFERNKMSSELSKSAVRARVGDEYCAEKHGRRRQQAEDKAAEARGARKEHESAATAAAAAADAQNDGKISVSEDEVHAIYSAEQSADEELVALQKALELAVAEQKALEDACLRTEQEAVACKLPLVKQQVMDMAGSLAVAEDLREQKAVVLENSLEKYNEDDRSYYHSDESRAALKKREEAERAALEKARLKAEAEDRALAATMMREQEETNAFDAAVSRAGQENMARSAENSNDSEFEAEATVAMKASADEETRAVYKAMEMAEVELRELEVAVKLSEEERALTEVALEQLGKETAHLTAAESQAVDAPRSGLGMLIKFGEYTGDGGAFEPKPIEGDKLWKQRKPLSETPMRKKTQRDLQLSHLHSNGQSMKIKSTDAASQSAAADEDVAHVGSRQFVQHFGDEKKINAAQLTLSAAYAAARARADKAGEALCIAEEAVEQCANELEAITAKASDYPVHEEDQNNELLQAIMHAKDEQLDFAVDATTRRENCAQEALDAARRGHLAENEVQVATEEKAERAKALENATDKTSKLAAQNDIHVLSKKIDDALVDAKNSADDEVVALEKATDLASCEAQALRVARTLQECEIVALQTAEDARAAQTTLDRLDAFKGAAVTEEKEFMAAKGRIESNAELGAAKSKAGAKSNWALLKGAALKKGASVNKEKTKLDDLELDARGATGVRAGAEQKLAQVAVESDKVKQQTVSAMLSRESHFKAVMDAHKEGDKFNESRALQKLLSSVELVLHLNENHRASTQKYNQELLAMEQMARNERRMWTIANAHAQSEEMALELSSSVIEAGKAAKALAEAENVTEQVQERFSNSKEELDELVEESENVDEKRMAALDAAIEECGESAEGYGEKKEEAETLAVGSARARSEEEGKAQSAGRKRIMEQNVGATAFEKSDVAGDDKAYDAMRKHSTSELAAFKAAKKLADDEKNSLLLAKQYAGDEAQCWLNAQEKVQREIDLLMKASRSVSREKDQAEVSKFDAETAELMKELASLKREAPLNSKRGQGSSSLIRTPSNSGTQRVPPQPLQSPTKQQASATEEHATNASRVATTARLAAEQAADARKRASAKAEATGVERAAAEAAITTAAENKKVAMNKARAAAAAGDSASEAEAHKEVLKHDAEEAAAKTAAHDLEARESEEWAHARKLAHDERDAYLMAIDAAKAAEDLATLVGHSQRVEEINTQIAGGESDLKELEETVASLRAKMGPRLEGRAADDAVVLKEREIEVEQGKAREFAAKRKDCTEKAKKRGSTKDTEEGVAVEALIALKNLQAANQNNVFENQYGSGGGGGSGSASPSPSKAGSGKSAHWKQMETASQTLRASTAAAVDASQQELEATEQALQSMQMESQAWGACKRASIQQDDLLSIDESAKIVAAAKEQLGEFETMVDDEQSLLASIAESNKELQQYANAQSKANGRAKEAELSKAKVVEKAKKSAIDRAAAAAKARAEHEQQIQRLNKEIAEQQAAADKARGEGRAGDAVAAQAKVDQLTAEKVKCMASLSDRAREEARELQNAKDFADKQGKALTAARKKAQEESQFLAFSGKKNRVAAAGLEKAEEDASGKRKTLEDTKHTVEDATKLLAASTATTAEQSALLAALQEQLAALPEQDKDHPVSQEAMQAMHAAERNAVEVTKNKTDAELAAALAGKRLAEAEAKASSAQAFKKGHEGKLRRGSHVAAVTEAEREMKAAAAEESAAMQAAQNHAEEEQRELEAAKEFADEEAAIWGTAVRKAQEALLICKYAHEKHEAERAAKALAAASAQTERGMSDSEVIKLTASAANEKKQREDYERKAAECAVLRKEHEDRQMKAAAAHASQRKAALDAARVRDASEKEPHAPGQRRKSATDEERASIRALQAEEDAAAAAAKAQADAEYTHWLAAKEHASQEAELYKKALEIAQKSADADAAFKAKMAEAAAQDSPVELNAPKLESRKQEAEDKSSALAQAQSAAAANAEKVAALRKSADADKESAAFKTPAEDAAVADTEAKLKAIAEQRAEAEKNIADAIAERERQEAASSVSAHARALAEADALACANKAKQEEQLSEIRKHAAEEANGIQAALAHAGELIAELARAHEMAEEEARLLDLLAEQIGKRKEAKEKEKEKAKRRTGLGSLLFSDGQVAAVNVDEESSALSYAQTKQALSEAAAALAKAEVEASAAHEKVDNSEKDASVRVRIGDVWKTMPIAEAEAHIAEVAKEKHATQQRAAEADQKMKKCEATAAAAAKAAQQATSEEDKKKCAAEEKKALAEAQQHGEEEQKQLLASKKLAEKEARLCDDVASKASSGSSSSSQKGHGRRTGFGSFASNASGGGMSDSMLGEKINKDEEMRSAISEAALSSLAASESPSPAHEKARQKMQEMKHMHGDEQDLGISNGSKGAAQDSVMGGIGDEQAAAHGGSGGASMDGMTFSAKDNNTLNSPSDVTAMTSPNVEEGGHAAEESERAEMDDKLLALFARVQQSTGALNDINERNDMEDVNYTSMFPVDPVKSKNTPESIAEHRAALSAAGGVTTSTSKSTQQQQQAHSSNNRKTTTTTTTETGN